MYAIIPSKKIYSYSSEKVADNKVDSVSIEYTIITQTEAESQEKSLSNTPIDTSLVKVSSEEKKFGTAKEKKITVQDTVEAQFAKSTTSFDYGGLVDFSKLEVLFQFATTVSGNRLSHTAIDEYRTYAINSEPKEWLPALPAPNSPESSILVDPTTRYIDNLFKKEVYFTISNITSQRATITVYFVKSVTLSRTLDYIDSNTKETRSVTVTSKNRKATISASYKQSEEAAETYGLGTKSFSYPSSELIRRIPYGVSTLDYALASRVLNDYADGKEVATILCEIGEYDFVRKDKTDSATYNVISQWNKVGYISIPIDQATCYPDEVGGAYNKVRVTLPFSFPRDIHVSVPIENKSGDTIYVTVVVKANRKYGTTINTSLVGEWHVGQGQQYISAYYRSKQTFQIGDSVCPMARGTDGKDKPLSTYADGTPKIFFVAAIKVYYDGAVWQELTLKEENKIV